MKRILVTGGTVYISRYVALIEIHDITTLYEN